MKDADGVVHKNDLGPLVEWDAIWAPGANRATWIDFSGPVTLEDHELVKIRFGAGFEADHDEALNHLLKDSESELAGRIGHTAVLYSRRAEEPEIRLP